MPRRPEEAPFGREQLRLAIIRLRERAGLKKAEAARRAGVSQGEWVEWEKGNRGFELGNLARALRGLGVTLHDLADELEGPQRTTIRPDAVLSVISDLASRNERLRAQIRLLGGDPDLVDLPVNLSAQEAESLLLRLRGILERQKDRTRADVAGETSPRESEG